MRKILIVLGAFALLFTLGASPASANASTGLHHDTFSCVPPGYPSESGTLAVDYEVTVTAGGQWLVRLNRAVWDTNPSRQLNALRVDLEYTQGSYREVSPTWGGSSTSLDDVSTSFDQVPTEVASWPTGNWNGLGWFTFNNTNTPQMRIRCYGMGPGAAPNDSDHNDVTYRPIK